MPSQVFLQPIPLVRKSGLHTAYVGDGAILAPGEKEGKIYSAVFYKGIAKNMDEMLFQRLKDAGVAGTNRPNLEEE